MLDNIKAYNNVFNRIYIISPTFYYDKAYTALDLDKDRIFENTKAFLDNFKRIERYIFEFRQKHHENPKVLLIFDDNAKNNKTNTKLDTLITNTRHYGISQIFLQQEIQQMSTTLRRNADAIQTFKIDDEKERKLLRDEFRDCPLDIFNEMLDGITDRNFLLINRQSGKCEYYMNFDEKIEWE